MGESVIVILSTHIVEDVLELSSKMAIIHQGRVLYEGGPEAAVNSLEGKIWQRRIPKAELKEMESQHRVISSKMVAGQPLVHVYSDSSPGEGFEPARPGLEDVFFSRICGMV